MIWIHSATNQTDKEISNICNKLIFQFFCISFDVLYTVVNYPNVGFTGTFLALSANKSKKIYNKIQNIWFPLSTSSVLQFPKAVWRCLTFVCMYISIWNVHSAKFMRKFEFRRFDFFSTFIQIKYKLLLLNIYEKTW